MRITNKPKGSHFRIKHIRLETATGEISSAMHDAVELAVDTGCDVLFTFNDTEYYVSFRKLIDSIEVRNG